MVKVGVLRQVGARLRGRAERERGDQLREDAAVGALEKRREPESALREHGGAGRRRGQVSGGRPTWLLLKTYYCTT